VNPFNLSPIRRSETWHCKCNVGQKKENEKERKRSQSKIRLLLCWD
jgi:hypothetical protein